MLTEADMIRILAEKHRLAESVADAYIDNEARKLLNIDEQFEMQDYDFCFSHRND
ncbi:MAG: hypothetical protein LJE83_00750 [Gammaproteobacteria bacterium]|jgi:hypothetical protein|nr:hypothetical protein [Gammaproteobacteria bacterium]